MTWNSNKVLKRGKKISRKLQIHLKAKTFQLFYSLSSRFLLFEEKVAFLALLESVRAPERSRLKS